MLEKKIYFNWIEQYLIILFTNCILITRSNHLYYYLFMLFFKYCKIWCKYSRCCWVAVSAAVRFSVNKWVSVEMLISKKNRNISFRLGAESVWTKVWFSSSVSTGGGVSIAALRRLALWLHQVFSYTTILAVLSDRFVDSNYSKQKIQIK